MRLLQRGARQVLLIPAERGPARPARGPDVVFMSRSPTAPRAGRPSPRRDHNAVLWPVTWPRPRAPAEPFVKPPGPHARPPRLGRCRRVCARKTIAVPWLCLGSPHSPQTPWAEAPSTWQIKILRPLGKTALGHLQCFTPKAQSGARGPVEGAPLHRGVTTGLTSLLLCIPPHQFLAFFFFFPLLLSSATLRGSVGGSVCVNVCVVCVCVHVQLGGNFIRICPRLINLLG